MSYEIMNIFIRNVGIIVEKLNEKCLKFIEGG